MAELALPLCLRTAWTDRNSASEPMRCKERRDAAEELSAHHCRTRARARRAAAHTAEHEMHVEVVHDTAARAACPRREGRAAHLQRDPPHAAEQSGERGCGLARATRQTRGVEPCA